METLEEYHCTECEETHRDSTFDCPHCNTKTFFNRCIGFWVTKDGELHDCQNKKELCPRCRKRYINPESASTYAISRTDNTTKICSPCGQAEALDDYFRYKGTNPLEGE